ncbi:eukaryotic translation initiation factor gamma SU (nucleomorph) [Guillardia theta]|uniref:protein-synthesizing GTPase n=1 Tax=Guillardia theta TaxID=55529 RepID=Q98RT0_GUITH|nr:eukaryotic translation initiation factor gamma SU [Guillardia theta]AAK39867.1 eukaryotic translation initiation factor gamma SU [Guillardia theta]|mmetsp:Transcript_35585/g.111323  ORF Transcript_35585/g.111323 Transcript_35585/m.111323 type:complete len:492 (-) Transcript_35585:353-1828(-)
MIIQTYLLISAVLYKLLNFSLIIINLSNMYLIGIVDPILKYLKSFFKKHLTTDIKGGGVCRNNFYNQSTLNVGIVGHVAHGKSTLVKSLTGTTTVKFKNELERNITIKLGYANCKIFKCINDHCTPPSCYQSQNLDPSAISYCYKCHRKLKLIKHISLVDCPGHEILMNTMLNGASVMNAAILVIAADEECPQPQTFEHLAALNLCELSNLIIIQNKIDIVSTTQAFRNYFQIQKLCESIKLKNFSIIPLSAQKKINMDVLLQLIAEKFIEFPRSFGLSPLVFILRSFDVNKPGTNIKDLRGGVVGGSIVKGMIKLNQFFEIRPGIFFKRKNKILCNFLHIQIKTINVENRNLPEATCGGLIGIGTNLDPSLTKGDKLSGQMMGKSESLPPIVSKILINYRLLKRLLFLSKDSIKSVGIKLGEIIMITVNNSSTSGKIYSKKKNNVSIELIKPICCNFSDKVCISRRINNHWRLVGCGTISKLNNNMNVFN